MTNMGTIYEAVSQLLCARITLGRSEYFDLTHQMMKKLVLKLLLAGVVYSLTITRKKVLNF